MKATHLNQLQDGIQPCPFCTNQAKLEPMPGTNKNWWRVRCADFHCGGTTWAMPSPDEATAAWNRRADGEK